MSLRIQTELTVVYNLYTRWRRHRQIYGATLCTGTGMPECSVTTSYCRPRHGDTTHTALMARWRDTDKCRNSAHSSRLQVHHTQSYTRRERPRCIVVWPWWSQR